MRKLFILGILALVITAIAGCTTTPKNQSIDIPNSDINILAERLNTPEKLQKWMFGNISYGWPGYPNMRGWRYESPATVLKRKKGECVSQSGFADYILSKNGYDTHLLFINRVNSYDHGVCYWIKNGKFYYIENASYGFRGLHGPFNSKKEIAKQVYDNLVTKNGIKGGYRTTNFDNTQYGIGWPTFIRGR